MGTPIKYKRGNTISGGPLAMDSLTYHYPKGKNQLYQVEDAVGASNYSVDIDNETSKYNYKYNAIGELAHDSSGGLDTIEWTVYGKVWKVIKTNGDSITFTYDPLGNRLEKQYYAHHDTIQDTTLYARDATGNIMAIYSRRKDSVKLGEWDIYGSSRIGSLDTTMRVYPVPAGHSGGTIDSLTIAYLENPKQYELDNHLGNVLVTVSDKKIAIDTNSDGIADYYLPNIVSSQDYYPFGMVEPGRSFNSASYRFAFNGKEKINEIYGTADAYDYGKRFYDTRLGRFLSIDPLYKKYPMLTPYQFASNTPIQAIDIDGLEKYVIIRWYDQNNHLMQGAEVIKVTNASDRILGQQGVLYLTLNKTPANMAIVNNLVVASTKKENNQNHVFSTTVRQNGYITGNRTQGFKVNPANGYYSKSSSAENKIENTAIASLESDLASTKPIDAQPSQGLLFNYPAPIKINFDMGSSIINSTEKTKIGQVQAILNANPTIQATVTGDASSETQIVDNNALANSRATNVAHAIGLKDHLNSRVHIPAFNNYNPNNPPGNSGDRNATVNFDIPKRN